MDFNVKKFAADAGTFLSRAVQVGGGGRGGGVAYPGGPGWGSGGGNAGAPSPIVGALAPGLADHGACLRRPEPRERGAAWRPCGPGRRPLSPLQPGRRPLGEARRGGDGAPGGHLASGLEPRLRRHRPPC